MRSLTIDRYPPPLGKVCKLVEMTDRQSDWLFKRTEVTDIWGVGRRIDKQLKAGGIATVLDLKNLDPATVKRNWSVVLERTVRELNGITWTMPRRRSSRSPVRAVLV